MSRLMSRGITRGDPLMEASPAAPPPPFMQHHNHDDDPLLPSTTTATMLWRTLTSRSTYRCNTKLWRYFIAHASREARKRKFNYCLGSFSCFLVVVISAVCFTLVARAPIVFFQQAELSSGQFDAVLTPGNTLDRKLFLNYTQLAENLLINSEMSYHSPRVELDASAYGASCASAASRLSLSFDDLTWGYIGDTNLPPMIRCQFTTSRSCLSQLCPTSTTASLWALDTDRERTMQTGRSWPFGKLARGDTIISEELAIDLNLNVGDTLVLSVRAPNLLRTVINDGIAKTVGVQYYNYAGRRLIQLMTSAFTDYVLLPLRIHAIIADSKGKLDDDETSFAIVEFSELLPHLLVNTNTLLRSATNSLKMFAALNQSSSGDISISPPINQSLIEFASSPAVVLESFASTTIVNLPDRVDAYMSSNYDSIQRVVLNWASTLMYYASFPQLNMELSLLRSIYSLRFFSIFFGLILSVILTILCILSIMLIYSLLMISVETRTFELGVHRMVGLTRFNIVKMLLVQAFSYSVPAWVVGLTISGILTRVLCERLEEEVEAPVNKNLDGQGVGIATFLGILIPVLSAILPIRAALSRSLSDALDTQHSKTKAVEFSIERSEGTGLNSTSLALGTCLVIFGFLVYYLLPLSLLSFNLSLFFNVFFGILLSMLFGLVLLALNLQQLLERLLVRVLLFWERAQVPLIVLKNLVAHRKRNRKTSIMFALSLGFILFITVAYQVEVGSAQYRTQQTLGAAMNIRHRNDKTYITYDAVTEFEALMSSSSVVRDWAWVTHNLRNNNVYSSSRMSNVGRFFDLNVGIYGVSPNFYEVTGTTFLTAHREDTSNGLNLAEQLYTPRGSQSAIVSTNTEDLLGLKDLSDNSSFMFRLTRSNQPTYVEELRPLAQLTLSPVFAFSPLPSATSQNALVSIPTFMRLSNGLYPTVESIPFAYLLVRFVDGAATRDIDAFKRAVQPIAATYSLSVNDARDAAAAFARADAVVSLLFTAATYIAMGLCLFSLMASMYTNIYEQSKEIAILRAVGLPASQMIRIYTYEAFILVLAASLLGVIIGVVMSWTMAAQRVLFTQLPMVIVFPFNMVGLVVIASAISALIASFMPARDLMKKKISTIMRTFL